MFVDYNPNPLNKNVGDCVIRAVSKALNQSWERSYSDLCLMLRMTRSEKQSEKLSIRSKSSKKY